MTQAERIAEKTMGAVCFGETAAKQKSKVFRRLLFVVQDIKVGEPFTEEKVRSIRPG